MTPPAERTTAEEREVWKHISAPVVRRLIAHVDALEAELAAERERKDGAYTERERCVALIAALAHSLGWKVGLGRTEIEGWSDDWNNITYIDLPTGQVSWHMHDSHLPFFNGLPQYDGTWDGHDTEEKYRRVAEQARAALAAEEG